MAQISPYIDGETLIYQQDGQPACLELGTPGWYAWLDTASTFIFRSAEGTFTARKERAGNKRGEPYWRAYRRRDGKLHRAYLGKATELTIEQLRTTAAALASERAEVIGVQPVAATGAGAEQHRQESTLLSQGSDEELPTPTAADKKSRARSFALPVPPTVLIGREQEREAICNLLQRAEVRLLTLVGTGGVGKTRLALDVAVAVRETFADGVCFVPLAAISDARRVMSALAQALGLWAASDRPLQEQVQAVLRERHLLLLLDNVEQVIEAAPQLVELLAACPQVKLLVTSRAALRCDGENVCTLLPLFVPDRKQRLPYEDIAGLAAVRLFVERAQVVMPAFALTAANARTLAAICTRLDGLPLAIELAAARIKLLSPHAILKRLTRQFEVLSGGAPDLPTRQQTLRATLAWSYDLLTEREQRLFRWLSVFNGGWTLEAFEAVCSVAEHAVIPLLDEMQSLLAKSLLQDEHKGEDEEPRLRMLLTIREFGLERLREHGEDEVIGRVHALYYLALAEEAEMHLKGADQLLWLARLEREQGNMAAALHWLLEHEEGERALCLSGALWRFWYMRGYWSDGGHWLKATLGMATAHSRTAAWAKVCSALGDLASRQHDRAEACRLLAHSVKIYRAVKDDGGLAFALGRLMQLQEGQAAAFPLMEECKALSRSLKHAWDRAFLLFRMAIVTREQWPRHMTRASKWLQNSRRLAETVGDRSLLGNILHALGDIAEEQGNYKQAEILYKNSLALADALDDKGLKCGMLNNLGHNAFIQGDLARAAELVQDCLIGVQDLGYKGLLMNALETMGSIHMAQGDLVQAQARFSEGLALSRQANNNRDIGFHLKGLAQVAAVQGRPIRAARMLGAADALHRDINIKGWIVSDIEQATSKRLVADLRAKLGKRVYVAAKAEGYSMALEDILEGEEKLTPQQAGRAGQKPQLPDDLTAREAEVLRLIALGCTDAQVAEKLVISARTVNAHLTTIYSKIQVSSRSEATRYALKIGLV